MSPEEAQAHIRASVEEWLAVITDDEDAPTLHLALTMKFGADCYPGNYLAGMLSVCLRMLADARQCGERRALCQCCLVRDHDGPHTCTMAACGLGQWTGTVAAGDVKVVRLPRMLR